ncbi:pentatricopeptide repeat-containing protein [Sesbania bispinosa]|nr:pentatricopeptide repeat-containing protein [Sesbania bispinosa]
MASTTLFTTPPPSATRSTAAAPTTQSGQVDRLALLIDRSKSRNQLLQIHAALVRRGLDQHPILNFKLQRRYSSVGHLHYSVSLFNRTHNPNVFLWTAIIHAHTLSSLFDQALSYYAPNVGPPCPTQCLHSLRCSQRLRPSTR